MTTQEDQTRDEHAADVVLVKTGGGYRVTKDRYGAVPRTVSAAQGQALMRKHGNRAIVR